MKGHKGMFAESFQFLGASLDIEIISISLNLIFGVVDIHFVRDGTGMNQCYSNNKQEVISIVTKVVKKLA